MHNTDTDIVIIGAGLTGLSLAYYLSKSGKRVMIIEKTNHIGGVIETKQEEGFCFETGPSTGVLSSVELAELFEELDCRPLTANKKALKRYIWKGKKWEALPSGLLSAIRTPLFKFSDKIRILGEPFRKAGAHPNETIASLVKRRLGKSFLHYAVDPFISGVYAGDPKQLITRFALPKLYELEQKYGSFIKGAIKKKKEPKSANAHKATREVFSVKGGLYTLIQALTNAIGNEHILVNCTKTEIHLLNGYYMASYELNGTKHTISCQQVVTTVGGYELDNLLPFIDNEQLNPITQTTYAKVVQVAVGYKNWEGIPLDAFGGLIPSKEKREVLGILFPSAIFSYRCPEGGALLSVFMGGMKKNKLIYKTDNEIENLVRKEIKHLMKEKKAPDLLRIFRYENAIAQYDASTEKRLRCIQEIETNYRGLILAGSIRDGIGMADRVKQAKLLANQVNQFYNT